MDNSDESPTFFKHVFNFDDDSKSTLLNLMQYSLISIIPIVILNKSMQKYIPEADDTKSSLEITAEVIIQVVVMFLGLFLIHRIVTFVPTYSGAKYPEMHVIYIVLAVLMITLSLQTKLGEKISLLVDRSLELWNGKSDNTKTKKGNNGGAVKVSQPLSGQGASDGTAIHSLPTANLLPNTSSQTQPLPNYDNMYRQDTNPLIGANTPGVTEGMAPYEPVAANSAIGGAFGAW